MKRSTLLISASAVGASIFAFSVANATLFGSSDRVSKNVRTKIEAGLPNTTFDRIVKMPETDLIAAETGNTVLYFTSDARFAIVGDVLDIENGLNLTDVRREQLAGMTNVIGKALGSPSATNSGAAAGAAGAAAPAARAVPPARPSAPSNMTVDLPPENMVVHNAGASTVLYVVVDYNCSYCRRLFSEMDGMDIEVREIALSYLSPDSGVKAAAVLCSDDPEALSASFLTGNVGAEITTCSDGVAKVEQNTQWAQDSGISGTPFLIRPDGQTNSGYLPADRLLAFIGQ